MATNIPIALKSADISRFALRAAQLEKYKPVISYWLEYYVLQQILTKALHNDSAEVSAYAAQLMDKLESTKQQYSEEPAVTDDIVAQAYMEQFASETLTRAEKAQNDDTVTKQTADTLQAAATFFETLSIWGELNAEAKSKIKFSKYHALRIVKALKNGQDPNATNPKPQPSDPAESELDEELRQLEHNTKINASQYQPTIEDVHDVPAAIDAGSSAVPIARGSPLPAAEASPQTARPTSIGGGYFPSTSPTTAQQTSDTTTSYAGARPTTEHVQPGQGVNLPAGAASTTGGAYAATSPQPTQVDAMQFYNSTPSTNISVPMPVTAPVPAAEVRSSVAEGTGFKTDDDAVMAAQKHAKWAISALNFEDVPTAVRELRKALESLGGL